MVGRGGRGRGGMRRILCRGGGQEGAWCFDWGGRASPKCSFGWAVDSIHGACVVGVSREGRVGL